jgi:hypothetical protein
MVTCSNCGKHISESRYYMVTWWQGTQQEEMYLCRDCYQANKGKINDLVMTHGGYIYPLGQDW